MTDETMKEFANLVMFGGMATLFLLAIAALILATYQHFNDKRRIAAQEKVVREAQEAADEAVRGDQNE